jgi:hypothetical protein
MKYTHDSRTNMLLIAGRFYSDLTGFDLGISVDIIERMLERRN